MKGCVFWVFFFFKPVILNYSLEFIYRPCAHRFKIVWTAAAMRDGAGQQREDPVFAANIPFKVALFAALTGHEYQAEGAEGAVDSTPTGCRCRLLRAAQLSSSQPSNAIYVSSMLPAPVVIVSCNLVLMLSSCQQWSYAVFISF